MQATATASTAPPPSGLRQRLIACALEAARVAEEERLTREAEVTRRVATFRAAAAAHAKRVDVRARRDFDGANPTALCAPLHCIDGACPRDIAALPGPLADALRAALRRPRV